MLQAPTAAADDGLIKDTTTQTFMKDVIEESKRQPVLVDFWADWCNPCKQLTPVLEKVVKAAKGKVKLVKLNTDKHPAIRTHVEGVEKADHPTDGELLDHARRFVKAADRMRP